MERNELLPSIVLLDDDDDDDDDDDEDDANLRRRHNSFFTMSDSDEFDPMDPIGNALKMHNNRPHCVFANHNSHPLYSSSSRSSKTTSLESAVKSGDVSAIREELQKNSDAWKFVDHNGKSMLHMAFEIGEPEKAKHAHHRQRRRILYNPRVRAQLCVSDVPQKGIIEILEIFLDLGLEVDARNDRGETPLWLAVCNRMNEVIEFLIARGADIMISNKHGDNLAHMAVMDEIFSYCSKHKVSHDFCYYRRESAGFWDWLLSKGVDVDCQNVSGETAYRMAIRKNLKNTSVILAKYSKEVHLTNSEGRNILHIFLDMDSDMDPYVSTHSTDILKILLDKGVPVNAADNHGCTPLHIAAKRRKAMILVRMLKHFTDVNARNERGDTVLHIAIDSFGFQSQSEEIIRTLISKGADIHIQNENGMTPVQLAAKHKDERVLRVLQENRADFSICTYEGETLLHLLSRTKMELTSDPAMVDLLVEQGCDVNATNFRGFTPLHLAASKGCVTVVKGLLRHGANVHSKTRLHQMTPLHLAALDDHEEMIEELVAAGADVNSRDSQGKTPLHLATRHSGTLLKTLIKCGALIDAKDDNGRLALHDVLLNNNAEGLEFLLASGADINDLGTPQQLPFLELVREKMIWNRVVEHLVTLKAARMPIVCVLKPFVDLTSPAMKKWFMECLQEIEDMRKLTIARKKNVYDLLLLDPYRRYNYVRTMRFKVLFISPSYFESTFRKYCGLIRSSYKEAIERRPLLEPAKYAWYQLTKIGLPDICMEKILAYLNNSELKTMIEGAENEMET